MHRSIALSLALLGCGARTPLELPTLAEDAAVRDAPEPSTDVVVPTCLSPELAMGARRWTVPGITGHPAVDRDGTIFAPTVEPLGGRGLAAIDPCGRVLWRTQGWVGTTAMRNIAQRPAWQW